MKLLLTLAVPAALFYFGAETLLSFASALGLPLPF